jgi:mono/diheme cytochrome c family protein
MTHIAAQHGSRGATIAAAANTWQESADQELRGVFIAFLGACLIASPILAYGSYDIYSTWSEWENTRLAEEARLSSHERLVEAAPLGLLPTTAAAHGRDLFVRTCAACHNPKGTGIHGLGKDLTTSWFVASLDDASFHQFLVTGRPDAKPTPMPAKGGNAELTDADLDDLVVFVRGLQDPRRMPELPAAVIAPVAPATEAEKTLALAAAGGDAELAEFIAHGTKVFAATCSACHGKDARGLPKNGKDLVASEFARKKTDEELLAFLKQGRDPGNPANTTGVAMPPKGGNPALSEDDLLDVIAYVRSLQKADNPK